MKGMTETLADLILRPMLAGDDTFVRALSRRAFATYSRNPARLVASMLEEHGAETVIAELGGTPVGFAVLGFEELARDFGPWKRPVVARLNAIAVQPSAHGRGIGRRLLARVEEMARARGAVSITLNTAVTNRRALRLFEPAGFLGVVTLPNNYARGQSAVAMFKPL
jgi:ribosomal protein S18 acetylase RimI-like enzyme